ncbi:MAG TPA: hypothetical protein V6C58_19155 [Allocoleopsis sp.]
MKKCLFFFGLFTMLLTPNLTYAQTLTVEEFKGDLNIHSSCGMWLFKKNNRSKNSYIFTSTSTTSNSTSTQMKINGKIVKFKEIKNKKNPKVKNYLADFVSQDGKIKVRVNAEFGKFHEESVQIKKGIIQVKQDNQEIKIDVIGGAGC